MNKIVKQYSKKLDKPTLLEVQSKAVKTTRLMNWVYTKFIGNKSYLLIQTGSPTYLRDKVLGKDECSRFGMQTRSTAGAIRDAVSNLKTKWSLVQSSIKELLKSESFNDHEKHYIYTVLKVKEVFFCVINKYKLRNFKFKDDKQKNFIMSLPALSYKDVDYSKVNNWIRNQVKRFKTKPKAVRTRQFSIESNSRDKSLLKLEGLKPRKKIKINLTDARKLNPTRLLLNNDRIEIHCLCDVEPKRPLMTNIIGVDKGYRHMISTSSGNIYGTGFSELISTSVDKQVKVGKQRNKLWALRDKLLSKNEVEKVKQLDKNNLRYKKFNNKSRKNNETIKNFINKNLNRFFQSEHPSEVIYENLVSLQQKKDNGLSRKVRNKLNKWMKGYLQERLNFKSNLYGSDLTAVNPAYTSQICSSCGSFGTRQGDLFSCSNCEATEQHADINAAKNILSRKYDTEIGLYTKYTTVKEILLGRIETSKLDQTQCPWTPKTLDTYVGNDIESILLNIVADYDVNQRANSKLS